MLVALGLNRHEAGQPVGCHPPTCQFGDVDRRAFAAQTVEHPCQGCSHDLGIIAGVGLRFMAPAVDLDPAWQVKHLRLAGR